MAGGDRVGDASIVEVLSKEACKEETKEQKEGRARKEVGLHRAGETKEKGAEKQKKKRVELFAVIFAVIFPFKSERFNLRSPVGV